jgi:mortality factor 4-like protein 1
VTESRLRKFNDDNKELAANLRREAQAQNAAAKKQTTTTTTSKARPTAKANSENASHRDSEDRQTSVPARGTKRSRNDNDLESSEHFTNRPSIRLSIPDHLKALLVDDWENVTKSLLLVPLPSQAPANFIIDTYYATESPNRRLGSPDADILLELCCGLKLYFEKSLPKILLYRYERAQLAEVRKFWENASGKYPEWEGKGPGDCYGAEHLARMLVNMPEIIAQTNMDVQSVGRLKEELQRFCAWLSRNSEKFFVAKYEKPAGEYAEAVQR